MKGNNPSTYGESLTFTATVTDTSDSTITPTGGTVTFYSITNNVQTTLGSATLKNGVATMTLPTLGVSNTAYTITATYSGTINPANNQPDFGSSTSTGTALTVNTANTSTKVAAASSNRSQPKGIGPPRKREKG